MKAFAYEKTYRSQYEKYVQAYNERASKGIEFKDKVMHTYEDFKKQVDWAYTGEIQDGRKPGEWKYDLYKVVERKHEKYSTKAYRTIRQKFNENLFNRTGQFGSNELRETISKYGEIVGENPWTKTGELRLDFFMSNAGEIVHFVEQLTEYNWHRDIDT